MINEIHKEISTEINKNIHKKDLFLNCLFSYGLFILQFNGLIIMFKHTNP
jgi:hypothetical protein